jgi:tRNA-dihydrouridine synthase B
MAGITDAPFRSLCRRFGAARLCVDRGAQIRDINMGCPAKKEDAHGMAPAAAERRCRCADSGTEWCAGARRSRRTRACRFKGQAEYETIAAIKNAVTIPVIANGDITTFEKSLEVLRITGADALMIGRGAQGRPWFS